MVKQNGYAKAHWARYSSVGVTIDRERLNALSWVELPRTAESSIEALEIVSGGEWGLEEIGQ